MHAMANLNKLAKTQQYSRLRASKLCDKIIVNIDNFSPQERSLYVEKLKDIQKELCIIGKTVIDFHIEEGSEDSVVEMQMDDSDQYDDKIISFIALLQVNSEIPSTIAPSAKTRNSFSYSSHF